MQKVFFIGFILTFFWNCAWSQKSDTLPTHVQNLSRVVITIYPIPYNGAHFTDSIVKRYEVQGLAKLLTLENGIYIKSYGLGGLATFSKRGASASQTQLLWNGIPVNSPTLGQQDLSLLPLLFVDNVGIVNTASFNGGLEGAINLSNQYHWLNGTTISYSKEIGSFGMNNTALKSSYSKGKWSGNTAAFKNEAQNNFKYIDYSEVNKPIRERENASFEGWGISQNVYRKTSDNEASLHVQYTQFSREIPSAIGVLNSRPYQNDNSFKSTFKFNFDKRNITQTIQVGYFKDELQYTDSSSSIFSHNLNQTISGMYRINQLKLNDSWRAKFYVNSLFYNAQSTGFDNQHYQFRNSANFTLVRFRTYSHLEFRLRQEMIDLKVVPTMGTVFFSKRLEKHDKWTYSGEINTNNRYPTLNDLYWNPGGNENLLPESSIGGELNLKYDSYDRALFRMAYFYSLTNNWIQWLPTSLGYWTPQNVKKVERQGMEVLLRKKMIISKTHFFVAQANYTFVNAINKNTFSQVDGSLGKQLIYVPKHTAALSASYVYKRIELSYQQSIYSKTYIDANNNTYLPYVLPASIQISGTLVDKNSSAYIALRIENLFNETYQIIANQPLPGRYVSLLFRLTLKNKNN